MHERAHQPARPGGFTLIELLVVIAILAILAGVVVFAVGNSTKNAGKAACKTERAAIVTAAQAAVTEHAGDSSSSATWNDYMKVDTAPKYFAVPATPTFPITAGQITRTDTAGVPVADCPEITLAELT
ncbi:MAG: type II secretion system protein [Microthrixaceae bacterium]